MRGMRRENDGRTVSQVVAQMPRGRFFALMALFLGPAVAVYSLFSIYPLIATMVLSTYTTDSGGAYRSSASRISSPS